MHSGIRFIEKIDYELCDRYPTFFNHTLKNEDILINLEIKKRSNGIDKISLIFEPTNIEIKKILHLDLYKNNEQIESLSLLTEKSGIFNLKKNIVDLIDKKITSI